MTENRSSIERLRNPYDFSHPVTDPMFFSGRRSIIEEIDYYLEHAKIDARPMNLAILGPRASGKTSLLNLIQWKAQDLGYVVARTNLNESDAESDLNFFFKIFDALFTAACDAQTLDQDGGVYFPFEGRGGRTFEAYVDMTTMFITDQDIKWRPFFFPVTYAKAMSVGNRGILVSEGRFAEDLRRIHDEIGRPIVLLIDECNVLTKNRVLLQKIRNTFMNIPGYMVVISGTPDLFPIMDNVFSPIARDFKRISVGRFDNEEEAEECVLKPLKSIGLEDPIDLFEEETLEDLVRMQGITEANPYQIQLACHFLFRDLQRANKPRMQFDIDVLDDMLTEVSRQSDATNSLVITRVRSLSKKELGLLSLLCLCSGHASFEQVWFINRVALNAPKRFKEELEAALDHFSEAGIVQVNQGRVALAGDEREQTYAKYYARKQGMNVTPTDVEPGALLATILGRTLRESSGWQEVRIVLDPIDTDSGASLADVVLRGWGEEWSKERWELLDLNSSSVRALLSALYRAMLAAVANGREQMLVGAVSVQTGWTNRQVLLVHDSVEIAPAAAIDRLRQTVEDTELRVNENGGSLKLDIKEMSFPPPYGLIEYYAKLNPTREFDQVYVLWAQMAYIHNRDFETAYWLRDFVQDRTDQSLNPMARSIMGYLYLSERRYQEAVNTLFEDQTDDVVDTTSVLLTYNRGVAHVGLQNLEAALESFGRCVERAQRLTGDALSVTCLFVLRVQAGEIVIEEEWEPNLRDAAIESLEAVKLIICGADNTD